MTKSAKGKRPVGKSQRPKHPWIGTRIAADRSSVVMEFLPGSGVKGQLKFSTKDEFTRFIQFLGDVRLEMTNATQPPDFKDLQKSHARAFYPRRWAEMLNDFSGSRITFDHPSFGHIRIFFPPDDLEILLNLFAKHAKDIAEHKAKQTK